MIVLIHANVGVLPYRSLMIALIGHAFLFRLLFRNKVLLIPNPGPSSDVEEDHHQHHEYQEDNAPDYRVALQSSIGDPEEEANH